MLDWCAMFDIAVQWVNEVLEFGAKKHEGHCIEEGAGVTVDEHIAKAIKHLNEHMLGREFDLETGCPALAHAAARVLLALQTRINADKEIH